MKLEGKMRRDAAYSYKEGQIQYALENLVPEDLPFEEKFKLAKVVVSLDPMTPSKGWVYWEEYKNIWKKSLKSTPTDWGYIV